MEPKSNQIFHSVSAKATTKKADKGGKLTKKRPSPVDVEAILSRHSETCEALKLMPCVLGGMKAFYRGNYFDYHYTRKGCKIYRCVEHDAHKCEARILVNSSKVFPIDEKHTH